VPKYLSFKNKMKEIGRIERSNGLGIDFAIFFLNIGVRSGTLIILSLETCSYRSQSQTQHKPHFPISLLSAQKNFRKIIEKQLVWYLANNHLSQIQYGGRKGNPPPFIKIFYFHNYYYSFFTHTFLLFSCFHAYKPGIQREKLSQKLWNNSQGWIVYD